ncbi:MAG: LysR substrate-binding domain-containing protein [Bacteroidota bacterium]|jgi:DNA-binding transcriptional LysR family regulator
MDIQDMRIFARVAAVQNLSAVGTELGLTPGTISKRIQALEDDLCARLFDRTTRSIRITEEGAKFLVHVERILTEIETARAAVSANVEQPKGKLKISAPASFGRSFVGPAITAFAGAYPDIEVQIDLTDRLVNLQEEGYDVVVRTGVLMDSSLIAKRLAPDVQIIAASPRYLEKHGVPHRPEDLTLHSCLVLGDAAHWTFSKGGKDTTVRVGGRLKSNNGDILRHAAIEGHGLVRISESRVIPQLKSGALCRVLADYEVEACSAIWALYPRTKHVLPKLRVFLDFLGEWFRDARSENGISGRAGALAPEPKRNELVRTRIGITTPTMNEFTRGTGRAR